MEWFAVRYVILVAAAGAFEERVTLWNATSAEEAISYAEREAAEYSDTIGGRALDLFQSYRLPGDPAHGVEVFSLIRDSELAPDAYVDAFFDTGGEYQQDAEMD